MLDGIAEQRQPVRLEPGGSKAKEGRIAIAGGGHTTTYDGTIRQLVEERGGRPAKIILRAGDISERGLTYSRHASRSERISRTALH